MIPAPHLLVVLILALPAVVILDGPIVQGVVTATAAALTAIVGFRIRPGEAGYLWSVVRPVAMVAVLPALWMLVQVIPLGAIGLDHPIWKTAAAALGHPLAGSISIDPGATLIAFICYLSMSAIAFAAAAVGVDRHRAETILYALIAALTSIGVLIVTGGLGSFILLSGARDDVTRLAASDSATLGIIFATAGALHALERGNFRAQDHGKSAASFQLAFLACAGAAIICVIAMFVSAPRQTYFAAACGIASLAIAILIRRFRLGPWGYAAIVSLAIFIAFTAVALQPRERVADIAVAFAATAPDSLISVTRHILADIAWAGNGAGTFATIFPIYRDLSGLTLAPLSPSGVATIAVEMGRPFLWGLFIAMVAIVIALIGGASRRGRDSAYSAVAASCAVTVTVLAFGNSGVLTIPLLLIASVAIGVGVAQIKSRSI